MNENCNLCGGKVEWIPDKGFEFNRPYCSPECEADDFEQAEGYACTACKLRAGDQCQHLTERFDGKLRRKCDEFSLDETASTYAKRSISPEHFQAYQKEIAEATRGTSQHMSDCATHNEPAYPNEPCDCEGKRI